MARATSSSERTIPHLRDIFGGGGGGGLNSSNSRYAAPSHTQTSRDLNDINYKFQNEVRVSSKSKGKDAFKADLGNDSAISVGSTSEDEVPKSAPSKRKNKRSSRKENARTLTERDVKHLERHLSMKKTIRKKIMRDLQQAFVEDPNEFRVEDISHEQLKAEINVQSLSFGTPGQKASKSSNKEPNFLDMLRANSGGTVPTPSPNDDQDSGHGSPTRELSQDRDRAHPHPNDDDDVEEGSKKTSFWRRFTMKGRNKR